MSWFQLLPARTPWISQSGCSANTRDFAPTRNGATQIPVRRPVPAIRSVSASSELNRPDRVSQSPISDSQPSSIWMTSTGRSRAWIAATFSSMSAAVTSVK